MPTVEMSNEDIGLLLQMLEQTTVQGREGAIRFLKVFHALERAYETETETEGVEEDDTN